MIEKQYEFRTFMKYCEECGAQLKLNYTRDIERKRFCSRACLGKWTGRTRDPELLDKFLKSSQNPISNAKKLKYFHKVCLKCAQEYIGTANQKWCKICVPNAPAKARMQRYNINEFEWQIMKNKFDGLCWICRTKEAVYVDHNHLTNQIRGALCPKCNSDLHNLEYHSDWLNNALNYIRDYDIACR